METDDGVLFLDMKCGNLMQQRISRIQTDQAVEIARLIKQYITIGESKDKFVINLNYKRLCPLVPLSSDKCEICLSVTNTPSQCRDTDINI